MKERIKLSKRDIEMSQRYGGSDLNDYTTNENKPYHSKGSHKLRSIANDLRKNGHRKYAK